MQCKVNEQSRLGGRKGRFGIDSKVKASSRRISCRVALRYVIYLELWEKISEAPVFMKTSPCTETLHSTNVNVAAVMLLNMLYFASQHLHGLDSLNTRKRIKLRNSSHLVYAAGMGDQTGVHFQTSNKSAKTRRIRGLPRLFYFPL